MAETDGTPRYRKSKPPKGANGRSSPSRNTRPNGKSRKRAALNSTQPTGAALEQEPGEAAPAKVEKRETDVVVKTMPTVIRAEVVAEPAVEPAPDAFAATQADAGGSGPRAKPQRGPNPAMLRSKRPLLASTLRMELTVHRNEGSSEPEISVRPTHPWTDGSNQQDAAENGTMFNDAHDGAATLPENAPRSRKPTAPGGFASTLDELPTRSRVPSGQDRPQPMLDETVRRGSDIGMDTTPDLQAPRPRRARRPGERTLIMTRRPTKHGSKRDWVFVVMLVAALGLTASMFLSRQAPSEEVVDTSAYDGPQDEDEQQPDPFATTLQPYKAKPAGREDNPSSAHAAPAPSQAAVQTESSISASTIQATELRSLPSGAEVVAGDAVVGSTPVRVARGNSEMMYTLRMPGHQPKIVRVGPQSPPSIMVELTRIVSGAPATPAFNRFEQLGQAPLPPSSLPPAAPSGNP